MNGTPLGDLEEPGAQRTPTANVGDTDALPSGPGSFVRAREGAVY